MSAALNSVKGGKCALARAKHTRATVEAMARPAAAALPRPADRVQQQQQQMHQAVVAPPPSGGSSIPMPPNVEKLKASEKARFSPLRTRDVSAKLNQVGSLFGSGFMGSQGSRVEAFNNGTHPVDSRIDVYDSRITVSLSSVMQTNVPKPFETTGKAPVHLNMPGGQWAQGDKYVSGDLHDHHHFAITSKKNPVE